MTSEEAGAAIGVGRVAISKWENDRTAPGSYELLGLFRAYAATGRITMSELVAGYGEVVGVRPTNTHWLIGNRAAA